MESSTPGGPGHPQVCGPCYLQRLLPALSIQSSSDVGWSPMPSDGSRGSSSHSGLPCQSFSHAHELIYAKQTPGSSCGGWCAPQGLGLPAFSLASGLPWPACAPLRCSRPFWPGLWWFRLHPSEAGVHGALQVPPSTTPCTGTVLAPIAPTIPSSGSFHPYSAVCWLLSPLQSCLLAPLTPTMPSF